MDNLGSVVAARAWVAKRRVLRCGLVDLHRVSAQIRCGAMPIAKIARDETIHARKLESVAGLVKLGVPPLMLAVDDTGLDALVEIGHLANLAILVFDLRG